MSSSKVMLVLVTGLTTVASCTTARRPETAPAATADQAFAEDVVALRTSLLDARARLDSMVGELHRLSSESSVNSVARTNELVKNIAVVDASYRARLADLLWIAHGSTTTRSPLNPPPSPLLQPFSDGEDWMLLSPMIATLGKGRPAIVIVPRGFVTDYASVPKPLRLLLPAEGPYGNAAVIHDYLYWRQDCTREQSDNIMAIAMKDEGVSSATARAIHIGVRLGGQGSWDANRRARDSGFVRTVSPPFDEVPPGITWDVYREWIHAHNGREGLEYSVPRSVCSIGDSVSFWN